MGHCPLSLVLVPMTMDKRRLCGLFVFEERVATVEVSGRDALVVALQLQLCQFTHANVFANDLRLFLARRGSDSTTQWLVNSSADASTLAMGRHASQAEATAARFFTRDNFMDPHRLLREYFPVQPPIYDGASTAIHVLVGHKYITIPRPLASPEQVVESPGWIHVLVQSLMDASSEAPNGRRHGGAQAPMPIVLQCAHHAGMLWLDNDDNDVDKTSMYVPRSWRQISSEIFKWAITNYRHNGMKGRRAILTGATRGGKSAFIGFLLFQLMRLRSPPVCIVDVPGLAFAKIDVIDETIEEGTRGVAFRAELRDWRTVYIYDASDCVADIEAPLGAADVYGRSIIAVPHGFAARLTPRTRIFVLPLWTQYDAKDAVLLRRPRLGQPAVLKLMDKWGGVPGRILTHDADRSLANLESALSQMTASKVMAALASLGRTDSWDKIASGDDGARWRSLVVPTSAADSSFEHTGLVAFTSQYVCDRVLALTPQRTWEIREKLPARQSKLRSQLNKSLEYLAQEEEEKNETPWTMAEREDERRASLWQWEGVWA